MGSIKAYLEAYISDIYIPDIRIADIIEIIIIAFIAYHLMLWIKNTKAWMLLKGIGVLLIFILIAAICKMNTILWLAKNSINVLATVAIVVFQPAWCMCIQNIVDFYIFQNTRIPYSPKPLYFLSHKLDYNLFSRACSIYLYTTQKTKT